MLTTIASSFSFYIFFFFCCDYSFVKTQEVKGTVSTEVVVRFSGFRVIRTSPSNFGGGYRDAPSQNFPGAFYGIRMSINQQKFFFFLKFLFSVLGTFDQIIFVSGNWKISVATRRVIFRHRTFSNFKRKWAHEEYKRFERFVSFKFNGYAVNEVEEWHKTGTKFKFSPS